MFNVKPSTNYFHMKTKIFADFQTCISVPLTRNTLLGKFDPKKQYCQFKLKLFTQTNSNMKNSMVIFIFFFFLTLLTFFASLVQKIHLAF